MPDQPSPTETTRAALLYRNGKCIECGAPTPTRHLFHCKAPERLTAFEAAVRDGDDAISEEDAKYVEKLEARVRELEARGTEVWNALDAKQREHTRLVEAAQAVLEGDGFGYPDAESVAALRAALPKAGARA